MALHVRGVLLPDDEVRDFWLIEDQITTRGVPGASTIIEKGFLLPGLVDAHCHIGIAPGGAPVASLEEARNLARIDVGAGVLAIRDAGSPFPYPELDDDPDMPRLARAGRHVAPPRRYLRDIGVEVPADQVEQEVRRQARLGNGWVKLVGDWLDRGKGDLAPAWDESTLTRAVQAAHDAGARITAHCFEESSVATLVRAGIDCVEHGTGLSLDLLDEMGRRGTALVPTMINIETFDNIANTAESKFPSYAGHMRKLKRGFPDLVRSAHEAGVPVYVGSDAGGGIAHGMAAQEMLRLHAAGIPADEVLAAGSWKAREWLGFGDGLAALTGGDAALDETADQAVPRRGDAARFYGADLTVYAEDPRKDLRVLLDPVAVILRGRAIRLR